MGLIALLSAALKALHLIENKKERERKRHASDHVCSRVRAYPTYLSRYEVSI